MMKNDGWFWKNLKIHQFFVLYVPREREREREREERRAFIFKRFFVKEINCWRCVCLLFFR